MLINAQTLSGRVTRKSRRPAFPVAGTIAPYGLYPIMAHPVLPGETLQSLALKWRLIGKPVKHPMAGAWLESWAVYVKLTDLDPDLAEMFISNDVSPTAYQASGDAARYFTKSEQIDWLKMCTEHIHDAYFLDEGESARTIDGVPMVKVNNQSWYQSMMFEPADSAVPTTDASDLYEHLSGWAMLQQMQMTELTYEQYLESYGVRPTVKNDRDPEILRFHRSWTQPVNTVDPSTGAPSSAWVWAEEMKLDKAKNFKEPGFVIVLATVRPKLYNANLGGSMIGELWGFSDWFPSYNLEDPTAGIKELAKTSPVFAAAATDAGTETLIYDTRDLLSHGETFINASTHLYRLPTYSGWSVKTGADVQDIRGLYPVETDIEALFVGDPDNPVQMFYEGIGTMNISGHVKDQTR